MTSGDHTQTGIVGGASVAAYDAGRIRRHETTRPDKQADRAAQIEAVGAQTGPGVPDPPIQRGHRAGSSPAPPPAPRPRASTDPAACATSSGRSATRPRSPPWSRRSRSCPRSTSPTATTAAPRRRWSTPTGPRRRPRCSWPWPSPPTRSGSWPTTGWSGPRTGWTPQAILAGAAERFTVEPSDGPVTPAAPGRFGLYLAGRWYRLTAPDDLRGSDDPVDQLDVAVLQRHLLEPVLGIGDPRRDPRIGFVGGVRPLAELEAAVDGGTWTAADLDAPDDRGRPDRGRRRRRDHAAEVHVVRAEAARRPGQPCPGLTGPDAAGTRGASPSSATPAWTPWWSWPRTTPTSRPTGTSCATSTPWATPRRSPPGPAPVSGTARGSWAAPGPT